MKLSLQQIAMVFAGVVAYFALLYYVHRALRGRLQAIFRYAAVAITVSATSPSVTVSIEFLARPAGG